MGYPAPTAPITTLIDDIETLINASINVVAVNISTIIMPVVSAGFGVYILLMVVNAWRGGMNEPPVDLFLRFIAWSLIIGVGLNTTAYTTEIVPILTGIPDDFAAAMPGSSYNQNTLDTLALTYIGIIGEGFAEASTKPFLSSVGTYIAVFLKAAIICLGLVPFLVLATALLLLAKVGIAIVAMLGPLFFAFLLFPSTRQYFSAWVSTAFSYALVPLLISVVAGISLGLSAELMPTSNLDTVTVFHLFMAALANLILLVILNKISGIASSLSAGGINDGTGFRRLGNSLGGLGKDAAKKGGAGARKVKDYIQSKLENSIKPG